MLKATGYRMLRIKITSTGRLDADAARATCVRKGLLLMMDGRTPSPPFRYRERAPGVYEFEQIQSADGRYAIAPPEQPDFLDQFVAGEPWGGTVKTSTA